MDAATQAHVRRSALKAVRAGMTQSAAAATFGVSGRAVNKWMAVDRTGGLRASTAKQRGRPMGAGRLSTAQAAKIRQQILDKMPDQLKLGLYLWTRAAVVALIGREYQVVVSLTTVGRYLKVWGCSMLSAITNRGHLVFRVFHGTFRAPMFVDFMRRLRLQSTGKVYCIVDGHPTHRSKVAKMFVAANTNDVRLIQLPVYCPEPNPDELLNQDVKTNALGKSRPRTRDEMMTAVRRHLFRRQKQPQVIKTLLQEKHVRYAA